MPGGRPVDHDQVPLAADRSSCLILPSTTMSSMPGRGRADDVDHTRRCSAAWRPARSRGRAGTRRARRARRSASTSIVRHEFGERRLAVELDDQHATARSALPRGRGLPLPWSSRHPPCPPPRSTRAAVNDRQRDRSLSGGTFAQTSDRPAGHTGRPRHDRLGRVRAGLRCRHRIDRAGHHRRRGPVDVLQVSGLFDPIVVDADRRRDRERRDDGVAGADPPGQQQGRRRLRRRGRGPARA